MEDKNKNTNEQEQKKFPAWKKIACWSSVTSDVSENLWFFGMVRKWKNFKPSEPLLSVARAVVLADDGDAESIDILNWIEQTYGSETLLIVQRDAAKFLAGVANLPAEDRKELDF